MGEWMSDVWIREVPKGFQRTARTTGRPPLQQLDSALGWWRGSTANRVREATRDRRIECTCIMLKYNDVSGRKKARIVGCTAAMTAIVHR